MLLFNLPRGLLYTTFFQSSVLLWSAWCSVSAQKLGAILPMSFVERGTSSSVRARTCEHTNLQQRLSSATSCCVTFTGLIHVANERSKDFESLFTQGLIQGIEQMSFRPNVHSILCMTAICFPVICLLAFCLFVQMSFDDMSIRPNVFRPNAFSAICISAQKQVSTFLKEINYTMSLLTIKK